MKPWIQLLVSIESQDVHNIIVCPRKGALASTLETNGLEVHYYKPVVSWAPFFCKGFEECLKKIQPDIIHTRLFSAAVIGGYWGGKYNIPVVATIDSRPKKKYFRYIYKTIAVSSYIKQQAIASGIQKDDINVIPNAVDVKYYEKPATFDSEIVRNRYGIRKEDAIIIAAGRFVGWKGFDVLIKAFKKISSENSRNIWLLLAGCGEKENKLKLLADNHPRIIFLGFVNDIRPFLWASNLYVLPSRLPEPFGLSLLEAMASGLLCVATSNGGPCDIINHDYDGWLVPPDDCENLANTLNQVLLSSEVRKKEVEKRAIQKAATFDVEQISLLCIDYYKKIS
jgi:glycosyltransferase involved in cell wall biosynthesis